VPLRIAGEEVDFLDVRADHPRAIMSGPPSMFDSPHVATAGAPAGDYIQPGFGHALRIWWALFWRTTLVATILQYGLSELLGVLYENNVIGASTVAPATRYGNIALNYGVALFAMYYVLHKSFRGFRIALCENWSTPEARILEPTMGRSTRIWWTYTWRSLVYTLILYVAGTIPLSAVVGLFSFNQVAGAIFTLLVMLGVSAVASLFAIYSNILDEDFSNFHVSVVPRTVSVPGAEIVAAPTQS
jgi:hypothetical protein